MGLSNLYNAAGKVANVLNTVTQPLGKFFGNEPMQYTAAKPTTSGINRPKFLNAIASNETGGVPGNPYQYSRSSGNPKQGRALGKYQITEGELKTYAPRYIGQSITPQQFLASSTAQDNYLANKANYLASQGYTPQQIADIHNKGITNSSAPGTTTYQNPDYVRNFNKNYTQ